MRGTGEPEVGRVWAARDIRGRQARRGLSSLTGRKLGEGSPANWGVFRCALVGQRWVAVWVRNGPRGDFNAADVLVERCTARRKDVEGQIRRKVGVWNINELVVDTRGVGCGRTVVREK